MLSPATAESSSFLNISTPVTTVFLLSSFRPTISTSSPTFRVPLSTLPVTTVPRPVMVNTSSTGIRKGLSVSLSGVGMYSSTASMSSHILPHHSHSLLLQPHSRAFKADPATTGTSSPGNSYSDSSSLTSISTSSSSSSSSTMSDLLRNTTM